MIELFVAVYTYASVTVNNTVDGPMAYKMYIKLSKCVLCCFSCLTGF